MKKPELDITLSSSIVASVTIKVMLDLLFETPEERIEFLQKNQEEIMNNATEISTHAMSEMNSESTIKDAQNAVSRALKHHMMMKTIREIGKLFNLPTNSFDSINDLDSDPFSDSIMDEEHDCANCDGADTCMIKDEMMKRREEYLASKESKEESSEEKPKGKLFGFRDEETGEQPFGIKNSIN